MIVQSKSNPFTLARVIRTAQIFGLSFLGVGFTNFIAPTVSVAQTCNPFGCSAPGAGPCNPFGCPNPGASPCTPFGCPTSPASNNNSNNNSSSIVNSAQASRSFQVVNNSGAEFYYFYASPAGQGAWSDDVLGSNSLPNGQAWNLTLSRGCQYDFQAQTYSGSTLVWRNIDVCSRNSITLNP